MCIHIIYRSRENDSVHLSSQNSTNQKTKQITGGNSFADINESSAANGLKRTESEVNPEQAKVVTKKKRGRPRKADQSKDSPLTANDQREVISGTLSLSQTVISTADNPEDRRLDNASSDNTVTPRRASTRVRTPRINIDLYNDAEENKRKRKRVKSNTPKKKGRKPKLASDENVNDDSVRDSNFVKRPRKKSGRKRKNNTAGNECHIGRGTEENADGISDNVDLHDDNVEDVDNENDDDEDGNVEDDRNGTI